MTSAPDGRRHPIVVLLIDDQAFVGAAIGQLLAADPDIVFHYCGHPLEAVGLANEISPTVILQDLVMPDMDGLTLLELFRTNPQTSTTPVVVLSGSDDREIRARALSLGAADYLVKLPAKADLIACIRRYATGGEPPAAAPSAPATVADAANRTLDRAAIAAFREADPSGTSGVVPRLIDQFLDEATALVAQLGDAATRADADRLQSLAHGLKGSAMTIGAGKLAALCAQVEHHSTRRRGGVIAVLMTEIGQELSRVREALAIERQRTD